MGCLSMKIKLLIKSLGFVLLVCLVQQSTAAAIHSVSASGAPQHISDAAFQQMILQYVNEYRAKHHRAPLKLINPISIEAEKHSREMATKAIPFGHQHFNTRVKHLNKEIKDCRGTAENVAYYKFNAKKLVDAWIASPGHRQNIEGNYNLTGIGIAHGKTGWAYYTQIFIRSDDPRYS